MMNLLFSERKSGQKKKGDFEILKKLCKKHVDDYLFEKKKVLHGPRLMNQFTIENKYNLNVMNHYFLRETKDPEMYPLNYDACVQDFENLFDMLELAYKFMKEFTDSGHRDERIFFFEAQNNESLKDWHYIMNQGTVSQLPEEGMKYLVNEKVPLGIIEDDETKIQHAIDLFFKRNSTAEDKKSALKALYEVLEVVREDLKSNEYLRCEEDDIFSVANNKRIRHMLEQKDKTKLQESLQEPYITWAFYKMLNTIKTYLKSKAQIVQK
jgi:hypothetical protein